jgi:hypothetical protein
MNQTNADFSAFLNDCSIDGGAKTLTDNQKQYDRRGFKPQVFRHIA